MIGMGDWRLLERNRELISNKKMRHNVRTWNYYLHVTRMTGMGELELSQLKCQHVKRLNTDSVSRYGGWVVADTEWVSRMHHPLKAKFKKSKMADDRSA